MCIVTGTTYDTIVNTLFQNEINSLITINYGTTQTDCYIQLRDNKSSVFAGDQFESSEYLMRQSGYTGDYVQSTNVFSKEPLALVTRDSDPVWSDFVNWVLQSLMTAEELNLTQANAVNAFGTTDYFGTATSDMFVNALAAVGNYGEIYEQNLEVISPRSVMNKLNNGSSGLIYSMPFGDTSTEGPGPNPGGTMETIVNRGYLKCGISSRAIFALYNENTSEWSGFDVDFCRAVSAALLNGVTNTIEFHDLSATERFIALENGTVDLLSRITTDNFQRDVDEPTTGVGFSFSQINFYDGLLFGGIPP